MYYKHSSRNVSILLIFTFIIVIFQGCDDTKSTAPIIHTRGDIDKTSTNENLNVEEIEQFLVFAGMTNPFTLNYSVKAIAVDYYTVDASGSQIIVSGALLYPQGAGEVPLVSIQHGTETKSDQVASVSPYSSSEGVVGLIMASLGYLVVIPDYPGFGVSEVMHPYMQAESLIPCVIDLLRAGRTYSSENDIILDGRVFLTGYSEGGFATLLTQKKIEEDYSSEFDLTAVAPMAGPFDLLGMSATVFQSNSYQAPAYLGFFFTAYNNIYGWNRLDDFFNEPYAALMPDLYDGSKTWGEIINLLPGTFNELMDPTFVEDFNEGNEQVILNALQENTRLNWTPQTPIHFFHGDADQLVPIQHSITAMNSFLANGATDVQLTTIPGGTHESAGPDAVIGAIEWFESLEVGVE